MFYCGLMLGPLLVSKSVELYGVVRRDKGTTDKLPSQTMAVFTLKFQKLLALCGEGTQTPQADQACVAPQWY